MLGKTILSIACAVGLSWSATALADDDDDRRGDRYGHHHGKALDFQPLSIRHLLYGVSQFSHGNVSDAPVPLKIANPNLVTQAAAALIYTRGKSDEKTPTVLGAYAGCVVRVLPPRSALGIAADDVPVIPLELSSNGERRYAELIWAPLEPVKVKGKRRKTRLADGLGGSGNEATFSSGSFTLTHPSRFTLPSNDIVSGQREAAIDCLCQGLAENDAPPDTFSDFGITGCAVASP